MVRKWQFIYLVIWIRINPHRAVGGIRYINITIHIHVIWRPINPHRPVGGIGYLNDITCHIIKQSQNSILSSFNYMIYLKLASFLENIVLVYAYCMCPSVGSWIYSNIYCDVITSFHISERAVIITEIQFSCFRSHFTLVTNVYRTIYFFEAFLFSSSYYLNNLHLPFCFVWTGCYCWRQWDFH